MKILFVLEHFHPYIGGVETLFASLGESLVNEGHQVQVVTSRFNSKLKSRETWRGISIYRVPLSNRFTFSFFSAPWILKYAREADLVHTTSYNAALPAWISARVTKTPVIITFHEYWGELWKSLPYLKGWQRWAYRWYERFILRLGFQKYIAVSEFTRQRLLSAGIPSEKVIAIHNGLAYDQLRPYRTNSSSDESPFTITYFGRLGVAKGLDFLTDLLSDPAVMELPIRWQIIIPQRPKTIYKEVMRDWVDIVRHERVAVFHNLERGDLLRKIATSSAVIIPSYSEGFCFSAAEAMALEVPIIHSGRGALGEVIGGKNLEIPNFPRIQGMEKVLGRALANGWDESPQREYPLSRCVTAYQEQYTLLIGEE